jgi:hypothetical protein
MSRFPRPLVFALAALTVGLVCLPAEAGAPGGGRFGGARAFGGMMGPGGGFNLVGAATNAGGHGVPSGHEGHEGRRPQF